MIHSFSGLAQFFPNGDFELGTGAGCACATNFICGNDAGRVVDGTHPVFVVGNQGCISSPTNYTNSLGAHGGTGYMYFYAGADNYRTAATYPFVGGEEVCFSVWYCGPQGAGASGQNTANAHFSFGVDGVQVGPDVTVPVNTGWTQHTFTMFMTPGAHFFSILSGGAAQYSIWTDDFSVDLCSVVPCDGSWTLPTPCSSDAPFNLNPFITGDAGGVWTGTGITGSTFDPSVGSQSITYTAPCGDVVTQTIVVTTSATATWTPPVGVCSNAADINLNTLITGTTGGVWSGTGVTGNLFDPSVGTQNITYTVGTVPCDDASTQTITITPSLNPAWTSPGTICETAGIVNLTALITGDLGGTWSGTGVTGTNFDPSGLSGPISISYSVGVAPCVGISTQNITVIADVDPSWTTPAGLCSGSPLVNLNTLITGTTGGTWSGTGVTGTNFDPSVGTQNVTYTVGTAPCDETSMQSITVTPGLSSAWTSPGTICVAAGIINLSALITGDPGGTWSGTGVTGTNFNPAGLSGPIAVTYTVGVAPCTSISTQNITVVPDVNPTWVAPTNLCTNSASVDLSTTVTGTAGGTWSGTGMTGSTFNPASGTQTITYTVGVAPCVETLALTITVGVVPNPAWTTLTVCEFGPNVNLNGLVTGTAGGTWSGTGVTGTQFDPSVGTQSLTYTVTSGACSANSTQAITVSNPTLTVVATNISCFGATNGSATVNVTNGSGTYTYSWTTSPTQTTATATNLTAGSYIVTVTDVIAGCAVTATVIITEPTQLIGVMNSVSGCQPNLGAANILMSGGTPGYTYVWNNSASATATATDLDSAMQTVTVTDANGCTFTDSIFVAVYPSAIISVSPDTTIANGGEASLFASGGVSYLWSPVTDLSCDDCAYPIASPPDTTIYCVTVTDSNACVATACTAVHVKIVCGDVFVPNAFSPTVNGENDVLCVYSNCIESMYIVIYDRWGEKVFESSSESVCWDGTYRGKDMNPGVFVYQLDAVLINGETVSQKGNISLVR